MTKRERILLVEDEPYVRESMAEILREEGIDVLTAGSVDEAAGVLASETVQAVLTDLRLPGEDGLALLRQPALDGSPVPVIVITGHGTVDDAVAAMKAGAYDFVQKPADPDQLTLVVRRALEHGDLVDEVQRLRTTVSRLHEKRVLAGSSRAMQAVRRMIEQVAPTDSTVLVTGESGTGKELVATEIHRLSSRAARPVVTVNCSAVPESLFESEFFGHRRGAFSGAVSDRTGRFGEAEGGTLVLDEIESLQLELQAKLLRVLESREYQILGESRTRLVDVRVVAVSNVDLEQAVREGAFRSDLFYRLNVFPVEMPPLRGHIEDVPEIAEALLLRIRERTGVAPPAGGGPSLDEGALAALKAYAWPGNVRELRNVLERALILAGPGGRIDGELLHGILGQGKADAEESRSLDLRSRLEGLERRLLGEALASAGGSKKEAARLLGIDPKNLSYYLRKHGLGEEGA